jgi:hypothetical protein
MQRLHGAVPEAARRSGADFLAFQAACLGIGGALPFVGFLELPLRFGHDAIPGPTGRLAVFKG